MQLGNTFHLTYCTNIHPSNDWANVFDTLKHYGPALKARLSPEAPFGIGLRLSGTESTELLQGDNLVQFKQFLDENGLYVFTMNGFPHGPFHNQPVKANVHAPDWRTDERVAYTTRLIHILAALLPEGMEGSISTSPLSYKAWVNLNDEATWRLLTRNVVKIAAELVRVRQEQGKLIHVDIEPEPDGVIETSTELVNYFRDWLLTYGADQLAQTLGIAPEAARAHLLDHIQVCFDTCHVAVAYENPVDVLARYDTLGIKVGKIQVSAALKVPLPDDSAERELLRESLEKFQESTYLHQVLQQNANGTVTQYPDLPEALPNIMNPDAQQWRIHFHVPIFIDQYASFSSTQDGILSTFALLKERPFTPYLEVETYTWDVLPEDMKIDRLESIERELRWVRDVFPLN
ncbi:MAG: metabolite traffic protein EboE [Anaerolineae bacterium]